MEDRLIRKVYMIKFYKFKVRVIEYRENYIKHNIDGINMTWASAFNN